ncbi:unnamed protein product [Rotaria socialis]|uniref:ADP ribosyltransferase domain-containing protein n=1 Tax=Rotaria socialis TaxID=392032 RepID=A0A821LGV8_9BILA|nr:unnamed protein product [Rotaria socialis]CAF3610566.1 unnamed protein product [Rotaria socialis]CAF4326035.1 unnamed protein product [Rotaria socialis]CAF4750880.1 unnamed protein product [Rotaria socialis]
MISSYETTGTCKLLLNKPLVWKIDYILEQISLKLNKQKSVPPLSATFTTFDRCKTKIDHNVCRPLLSSTIPRVEKKQEKEPETVEDLIIIWLDENINQNKDDLGERKSHLREIVNCLKTFDKETECFDFIGSIKNEKILLIISGSLAKTFINKIHDMSQVLSVYIYCFYDNQYEQLKITHRKIVGKFTDEHGLIKQITQDVASFFNNYLPVSVINSIDTNENSTQDIGHDQAKFMWSQLLMDFLLHLPQTTFSKCALVGECRRHYKNNTFQQKKIAEFEKKYNSSNAILWYTRDNFLFRIINKALRTQNILYILKCRFFITDMHHYVKSLHSKFIKTLPGNFLTVYRGQMMTAGEFAKLQTNINGFIAINTFFSTTYSSVVAITFAGDGSGRPMFESIFFEIEINLSLHKTPFADVHKISQFGSEKEIILSMGSSFRIEFIEPMSDKLWHVKLISASEKDTAQLDDLARYLKKNINNESNYLLFGKILRDMGQYDQAEKFYELLLTELPSNHQDIAAVYSCLGSTISKTQKNH